VVVVVVAQVTVTSDCNKRVRMMVHKKLDKCQDTLQVFEVSSWVVVEPSFVEVLVEMMLSAYNMKLNRMAHNFVDIDLHSVRNHLLLVRSSLVNQIEEMVAGKTCEEEEEEEEVF